MKGNAMVWAGLVGLLLSCAGEEAGRTVQVGDIVLTHFSLSLANGTRLDESRHEHTKAIRGQPLKFKVGSSQVIRGWDTGVLGMSKGEVRKIILPPALAYGQRPGIDNIQPGDTLVLELELIGWAD